MLGDVHSTAHARRSSAPPAVRNQNPRKRRLPAPRARAPHLGYLTSEPPAAVEARLCRALLELATSHGVAQRFHHTLTIAWVRLIESARRSHPDMPFDALIEMYPSLLDKDAPLAYYTREHLYSEDARTRWVAPNLKALPDV